MKLTQNSHPEPPHALPWAVPVADPTARMFVDGEQRVSFMRAEHAPTPGNFAAHAVDISGALAGVRKAALAVEQMHVRMSRAVVAVNEAHLRTRLMPNKPADRRTFFVLGKPMYYYELDGKLHLAKGESPWT